MEPSGYFVPLTVRVASIQNTSYMFSLTNYLSSTNSITTGEVALIECFKFAGMWIQVPVCAA